MFTFLVILSLVSFVCLLMSATIRPAAPPFSLAELTRRAAHSAVAKSQLQRAWLLGDVELVLRIKTAFLLVITVLLTVVTFGWVFGVITAVVVAVVYPGLARTRLVHRYGQRLYERYEPLLLRFVVWLQPGLRVIRRGAQPNPSGFVNGDGLVTGVASREELAEVLAASQAVLTKDQQTLITAALAFEDKKVSSCMTPKTVMKTIRKEEFLGPLVLDELHALGHSRLPVTDGDLDHIVGMLHLRDLLSLDIKRSTTAEKAMEPKVFYIHQDDSLHHALSAFLRVRHHLFVVINDTRETVGLLSLEDVIEALIGRRIVDEDDIHADLRAVAKRQGQSNNAAPGHVDL